MINAPPFSTHSARSFKRFGVDFPWSHVSIGSKNELVPISLNTMTSYLLSSAAVCGNFAGTSCAYICSTSWPLERRAPLYQSAPEWKVTLVKESNPL